MSINEDYAMLFPGQGSQFIGMLEEIYVQSSIVRDTFIEASDTLGMDIWAFTKADSDYQLNLTENTQPVLLCSSVALWREFMRRGAQPPSILAGHSLGEFSALVCAECIDFASAVMLVRNRGQYMQSAVPVGIGSMAAILGLDDEIVDSTCHKLTRDSKGDLTVNAVNYNSPGQVVIAGHKALVDKAINSLKKAGAKRAVSLAVSAPFHTPLMRTAGQKLALKIQETIFSAPKIRVLSNVTAQAQSSPDEIKKLLVEQISSPVNWVGCMRYIISSGVKSGFECGSGSVLSGLCRRIDRSFSCSSLERPDDLNAAVQMSKQYGFG